MTDTFNGDNAKLVECIDALLAIDSTGNLAPHGIGGHARDLLAAAASRLDALSQPVAEAVALRDLYSVLRDRFHGRMPDEVRVAYEAAGSVLASSGLRGTGGGS